LLSSICAIFQLYHGENKLQFNEMVIMFPFYYAAEQISDYKLKTNRQLCSISDMTNVGRQWLLFLIWPFGTGDLQTNVVSRMYLNCLPRSSWMVWLIIQKCYDISFLFIKTLLRHYPPLKMTILQKFWLTYKAPGLDRFYLFIALNLL
jgi:hypothetical protein